MPEAAVSTTLAIPQLVTMTGAYPPPQGGGNGAPSFTVGMIQGFAGPYQAFGAPGASGQLLTIQSDVALFSVYGSSFGGNATTNFALPDLDDVVAVGGAPGQAEEGTLGMTWLIAVNSGGAEPLEPFAGTVALFGGAFAPDGWLVADGSVLAIEDYPSLFGAIENSFGGDGSETFALPDLGGAAPMGLNAKPGRPPVALGQSVSGDIPGLGLNYLICITEALYPGKDGTGEIPAVEPFLGQIVAYAGSEVPKNWAVCDGSPLPIALYSALYSIVGTTYGGDGVESFALPDLSGRMIRGKAVRDR